MTLVGPKGLERVVNALRVIAPELPFEIKFIEITQPEQVIELNGYRITAFKVNHNVLCYGYTLEILRQGKFSAERAKEQEIPLKYWNPLQKGHDHRSRRYYLYTGDGTGTCEKRNQAYLYNRYQTNRVYPANAKDSIFLSAKGCTEKMTSRQSTRI